MNKQFIVSPIITLPIEKSEVPLHRQIYEGLRVAILGGQFAAKARLPATRSLAEHLNVSRMTVVTAYEQLLAEGYVEGRIGAGTFVATVLPEESLHVNTGKSECASHSDAGQIRRFSKRGQWLATHGTLTKLRVNADAGPHAFQHGLPAIDEFPFKVWSQLLTRRFNSTARGLLGYGDPAGYRPLRESIAAYLRSARAVRCETEQVIIASGAQQALDLAARVLIDADDPVWVENPCYTGARQAFSLAGAKLIPVPIDKEGLDLAAGLQRCRNARLVYVTPSHQFPLGITMSLSRRLALLEWAKQSGSWIVEDDYNSEYRYAGRPLASLQGLDRDNRVIYVGTFSKTIFPSLRLGCIVAPPDLVDAFVAARALADRQSPSLEQAVLADFMAEGYFARHVRRMRTLYRERQEMLIDELTRELKGALDVAPAEAGMHLIGWLPQGMSDESASEQAALENVETAPLSTYCLEPIARDGLLLGYTAVNPRQIRSGVRRLARALKDIKKIRAGSSSSIESRVKSERTRK